MDTTQHPMYQKFYSSSATTAALMPTPELIARRDGAERIALQERPGTTEYVCSMARFAAYDQELIQRAAAV
jgi:hypothetical protein